MNIFFPFNTILVYSPACYRTDIHRSHPSLALDLTRHQQTRSSLPLHITHSHTQTYQPSHIHTLPPALKFKKPSMHSSSSSSSSTINIVLAHHTTYCFCGMCIATIKCHKTPDGKCPGASWSVGMFKCRLPDHPKPPVPPKRV